MTSHLNVGRSVRIVQAVLVALVGVGGCARHRATLAPTETIIVKVQEDPQGKLGTLVVVDTQTPPSTKVAGMNPSDKATSSKTKTSAPENVSVVPGAAIRSTTPSVLPTMPTGTPVKAVEAPAPKPMGISIPAISPEPEGASTRPVTIESSVGPIAESIVPVKAETRSLPGMPFGGAESLNSADSRFAHAPNYTWIVGELEYLRSRNIWRIRFATPGEANAIGGTVTLAGSDGQMDGLSAGTLVRVEGSLVDPETREASPRYQVRTIRKETAR